MATSLDEGRVAVDLETRLVRSPLRMFRRLSIGVGEPFVSLFDRILNEGAQPFDLMWTQHPSFGPPFLDQSSRIETGARTLLAGDSFENENSPLELNSMHRWPMARTRDDHRLDLRCPRITSDARYSGIYLDPSDGSCDK